jgi:hypothetical protein
MKIPSDELMVQYKENKLFCAFCGKLIAFVDGKWFHVERDDAYHEECYQDHLLEMSETNCYFDTYKL